MPTDRYDPFHLPDIKFVANYNENPVRKVQKTWKSTE